MSQTIRGLARGPRRLVALMSVALVALGFPAGATAGAARGPLPFVLPADADTVTADRSGAAVFVVRESRDRWSRLTAHPGERRPRTQVLFDDVPFARLTAWFGTSSDAALFASEFEPSVPEGSPRPSVVQVIPLSPRGAPEAPVTISSPGAYASDPDHPVIGPGGAAAVLFEEGPDRQDQSPVLAMKLAGSPGWLPPIRLPEAKNMRRTVLYSPVGGAVLLTFPSYGGTEAPTLQRIDAAGALGVPIDLGFREFGLAGTDQVDLEVAFASDGTLHVVASQWKELERPKDPTMLLWTRLAPDSDRVVSTVVSRRGADPYADNPSLSLAPGLDGAMALVASQQTNGNLRIFEAKRGGVPRLTSVVRASPDLAQGGTLLRAPDGGLNLVWVANVARDRGFAGLLGAHRRAGSKQFSRPRPLSRSVLSRGSVFLDEAAQLPDGNVAIAYGRNGGPEDRSLGLIARP